MHRFKQLFEEKRENVLAVYFTAGHPKLEDTRPILRALQSGGADIIEIGMPFSDPLADGEVIQHSSAVALRNGMNIHLLFNQLEGVRGEIQAPLVLMGYLNPVLQYGMERFLRDCVRCGIDALILPDMPVEVYEAEYEMLFKQAGLGIIFLVTPRTPEARIQKLAGKSEGFLYLVSSASTTGATGGFSENQKNALADIVRLVPDIPVLTGFGIHNAETFHDATGHTRGGIVGSAFIKLLEKEPDIERAVQGLMEALGRA